MLLSHRLISRLVLICCGAALFAGCAPTGVTSGQIARSLGVSNDELTAIANRPSPGAWYAIWGEGAKPSRMLVYAKDGVNGGGGAAGHVMAVDVMLVYESAQAPDSIEKELLVNCRTKQYTEKFSYGIWRDGRVSRDVPPGWQPLRETWQGRAAQFACSPVGELTPQNGFQPLNSSVHDANLVKLTWDSAWQDGVRPPNTQTKAQVAAQLNQTAQQLKDLRARSQQAMKNYLGDSANPYEKLEKDSERTRADYLADVETAKRRSGTFNLMLETWVGASEQQIVDAWGRPDSVSADANGNRLLDYVYGNVEILSGPGGGGSIPHECRITWVIRNGAASTYRWNENDGTLGSHACSRVNIGTGPFPEKRL